MKTASMPTLRVDPELRHAAENVLLEGESLSSFMEQALRAQIAHRQAQRAFLARALASRDAAAQSGEYYAAADVLRELDDMLSSAQAAM
jgi:predicted transcriptional regulator